MDLVSLLNGLVAQLADAQKAADNLAKAKYDEGFAAGVASVPANDKIYSQAEVDSMLAVAVGGIQAQLSAVSAELQALKDTFAAFKAQELAKVQALEADFQ